jgi:orotate phosphoribosyltransferase
MKNRLFDLLKKHSFKEGDFTLSSGKKSKFFLDCKQTLLFAEGHYLAGFLLLNQIRLLGKEVHGVAGVELGGCSLASSISLTSYTESSGQLSLDALYVRKKTKDHGTSRLIEGYLPEKSSLVLVEDTITTGESSLKALRILRENNFVPIAVLSIVDREEGGKENIKREFNIPVYSLFSLKDFTS